MNSGFVMAPEDFVKTLYRAFLGRTADAEGLAHWVEMVRSTGDPTRVLEGILNSAEYAARANPVLDCREHADRAMARIDRRLRVVDAGAQSLGAGSHPYQPLLDIPDTELFGFDPLAERLRERMENESAPGLILLPYALGDGGTYTLHVNNEDATSSLFPLNTKHNARFHHLSTLHTVRTEKIKTYRLDEVLPEGPVDFLKLDIQGAELMVLQASERTLLNTAVVHCEVEFSPIYTGQALFPAVHEFLMSHGFELIDLLIPGRYQYLVSSGRSAQDRLLWADAVFFRETNDSAILKVQALIAAIVYDKPTLAEYLLHLAEGS